MSTLVIAALLIGFIVTIFVVLVNLENKQKQKSMNKTLKRFSAEGVQNNLSFSSQEFVTDGIIGLDGVNRKLLFLKREDEVECTALIINLADVKRCLVKKHFGLLNSKEKMPGQFLDKIVLRFEFHEQKPSIELTFFDNITNSFSMASELETKANHWEAVLSKMITQPQRQRA
jgi:hypothetical protein